MNTIRHTPVEDWLALSANEAILWAESSGDPSSVRWFCNRYIEAGCEESSTMQEQNLRRHFTSLVYQEASPYLTRDQCAGLHSLLARIASEQHQPKTAHKITKSVPLQKRTISFKANHIS